MQTRYLNCLSHDKFLLKMMGAEQILILELHGLIGIYIYHLLFLQFSLKTGERVKSYFLICIMPTYREHQALPNRWLNNSFFGYNKIQSIYNLPANSTLSVPIAAAHKTQSGKYRNLLIVKTHIFNILNRYIKKRNACCQYRSTKNIGSK